MKKEMVIASMNKGKIKEFMAILSEYDIMLKTASDFNLPDVEETENTFVGNALLKARSAAELTGLPAIADDSGLCIHCLNNRPGVYSARYNNPKENGYEYAFKKINEEMGDAKDRSAHFVCCIVLTYPNGKYEVFEDTVEGTMVYPPRGVSGFGYDPMFMPKGYDRTFGEMDPSEKHPISHRGKALKKFAESLKEL